MPAVNDTETKTGADSIKFDSLKEPIVNNPQQQSNSCRGEQPRPERPITTTSSVVKRRRNRLRRVEVAVLEQELLARGSDWPFQVQAELGARLGISRVKVYKWLYDRKKKQQRLDATLAGNLNSSL